MARRKNTAEAFEVLFRMAAERARSAEAAAEGAAPAGEDDEPGAPDEATGAEGGSTAALALPPARTSAELPGEPDAGALVRRPAGGVPPRRPGWAGGGESPREAASRGLRWGGPYREPLLRRPAPEGADRVRPGRYSWPPRMPQYADPHGRPYPPRDGYPPRDAYVDPRAPRAPIDQAPVDRAPVDSVGMDPAGQYQPPWRQVAEGSLLSRWLEAPHYGAGGNPNAPAGASPQADSVQPVPGEPRPPYPAAPEPFVEHRVPQRPWPTEATGAPAEDPALAAAWAAAAAPPGAYPAGSAGAAYPAGPPEVGNPAAASPPEAGGPAGMPGNPAGPPGSPTGTPAAMEQTPPTPAAFAAASAPEGGDPTGAGRRGAAGGSGITHWSDAGAGSPQRAPTGTAHEAEPAAPLLGEDDRDDATVAAPVPSPADEAPEPESEDLEGVVAAGAVPAATRSVPEDGEEPSDRERELLTECASFAQDHDAAEGDPSHQGSKGAVLASALWRYSGLRWLMGDRSNEMLAKPVELRGGTLVVLFLSTIVVTFLLAAAWIIPRPQRFPGASPGRDSLAVGDFSSGGEPSPTAPASARRRGGDPRGASEPAPPVKIEDERAAVEVARRQRRARRALPGRLQYWSPGDRPGADAAAGDAEFSPLSPRQGAAEPRELSEIRPRPRVSGSDPEPPNVPPGDVEAPAPAPAPPAARYRVLVRSNADRRETEAFEAYFVENLGVGCYLEADGGASGADALYRVFLDRKFADFREANAFCREVRELAAAKPFGGDYFLDALPYKGNW